jgi:electron transport complex protein RnfE
MRRMESYRSIFSQGLWTSNPGLTQLLGICPLLAVSNSAINGLALGLATLAVLLCSNVLVSAARHWISPTLRLPAFVLIIASLVTITELVFQAYFFELYLGLGIFIPLIVTNCVILGRAEAFASRNGLVQSAVDGLAHGLGFALVLVALGSLRELIGRGTLLHGAEQLFGSAAAGITLTVVPGQHGLLLAMLPPGAFICLALLVAGKRYIDLKATDADTAASTLSNASR